MKYIFMFLNIYLYMSIYTCSYMLLIEVQCKVYYTELSNSAAQVIVLYFMTHMYNLYHVYL